MKRLIPLLTLIAAGLLLTGCSKRSEPLEPLALADIPAMATNLFESATEPVRTLAYQAVAQLQRKDPGNAWGLFSKLAGLPDLTKEQQQFAARALVAASDELTRQVEAGDQRATQLRQTYRANK